MPPPGRHDKPQPVSSRNLPDALRRGGELDSTGRSGRWIYGVHSYRAADDGGAAQTGPEFSMQNTRQLNGTNLTYIAGVQFTPFWYNQDAGVWRLWARQPDGSAGWVDIGAGFTGDGYPYGDPHLGPHYVFRGHWYYIEIVADYDTNRYVNMLLIGYNQFTKWDLSGYEIAAEDRGFDPAFWLTLESENLWTDCGSVTSNRTYYEDVVLTSNRDFALQYVSAFKSSDAGPTDSYARGVSNGVGWTMSCTMIGGGVRSLYGSGDAFQTRGFHPPVFYEAFPGVGMLDFRLRFEVPVESVVFYLRPPEPAPGRALNPGPRLDLGHTPIPIAGQSGLMSDTWRTPAQEPNWAQDTQRSYGIIDGTRIYPGFDGGAVRFDNLGTDTLVHRDGHLCCGMDTAFYVEELVDPDAPLSGIGPLPPASCLANQAPTVDAGGPYAVDEGASVTVTADGADQDGDEVAYRWDLDGDAVYETAGRSVSFSAAGRDGPDNPSVCVQADDGQGGTATDCTDVAIANVPPEIADITGPLGPMAVGSAATVSASLTDAGTPDTHTCTLDWGDATSSAGVVTEAGGSGVCSGSHVYASAGVYTVGVTVADDDGDSVSGQHQEYVVVYDPDGGFVTGGGWIHSPAGACQLAACSAGTTGRANFGFVSKYQPGANRPSGNTQFDFKAGGLNFHSSSYDWLVVAGQNKAKFKGMGTINGAGSYGFMLTATDGSPDTFRIKIWDQNDGNRVMYDNQMGAGDDGYAGTAIGGGNIKVHRP